MLNLHRLTFFMLLFIKISVSTYNEQERMIMLKLCKKLEVNICLLVEEEIENNKFELTDNLKYFQDESIFVRVLHYDELTEILEGETDVTHRELLVLKGSMAEFENMIQHFKTLNVIHQMHRYMWLAFVEDHWIENKANLSIPYDCEFIIVRQISETKYTFTEIFEVENRYFFSNFGIWDHEEGLKITDPFIYTRRPHLNQTETFTGYEDCLLCHEFLELLHSLSQIINLKLTKILEPDADDNILDRFYENLQKHMYIDAGPTFLLADIYLNETTNPLFRHRLNWFIKHPQLELKSNFYLKPFENNFRLVVILSILVGTALVLFTSRFRKNGQRCVTDDGFLVLAYFCNQDGSQKLKNVSERISSLSFRLIGFIVISSFGALITSYWTAQPTDIPFTDLKTFSESKVFLVTNLLLTFMLSEAVLEKLLTESLIDLEFENSTERICQENVAVPYIDMEIYRTNVECDLYQIDEPIGYVWMIAVLSPNNPLRGILNYYILRLYESGIQHRAAENLKYLPSKKTKEDGFKPIEFQLMRDVFMIPFGGTIIGVLLLVMEFFYFKFQTRFKFRKKPFRSLN